MHTSLPLDKTQCACTTVKKLSRVLGRVYDAQVAPAGINITQFAVLRCMKRLSGEPLVRVAEELELDRTTLYRAITLMVRDGWIISEEGVDARSRTAKLTRKGNQVLQNATRHWDKAQNNIVHRFGEKNYDALLVQLYRLAECAEAEA